jgi:hypothetical protein
VSFDRKALKKSVSFDCTDPHKFGNNKSVIQTPRVHQSPGTQFDSMILTKSCDCEDRTSREIQRKISISLRCSFNLNGDDQLRSHSINSAAVSISGALTTKELSSGKTFLDQSVAEILRVLGVLPAIRATASVVISYFAFVSLVISGAMFLGR